MATFMAMNNLPLRITVSDTFRELVTNILALRSPYIMSIPNIRNETMSTHMALRQALFTRLSMPNTYCTIAFDGWTNCTGAKITNVMAINNGIAYFIKSIPNAYQKNTAEWMMTHIVPVMDDLIAAGIKINAIVTDNGAAVATLVHMYGYQQTIYDYKVKAIAS